MLIASKIYVKDVGVMLKKAFYTGLDKRKDVK